MEVPRYDVYLTGKLADGVSPELAAQRLAGLFKSTPEAMAGLLTGRAQLLKRDVDKGAALKYRDALQKAGCEVAFKARTAATATPTTAAPAAASPAAGLQLAPTGEDLLRADERHHEAAVAVDISHLSVAPVGPLPAAPAVPVAAPDISDLALAAQGGNLLDDAEREVPPAIAPDTDGLSLAEAGAPLETLKSDAVALNPDTSDLQLAAPGSDVLTPEQREHAQPPPPNTDHIKLAP